MTRKKTNSGAWDEEEALKEQVYLHLEEDLKKIRQDVNNDEAYVRSGAFEDQDAFTAYGALSANRRKELRMKQMH